jgi:hypothetical protein
MVAVRLDGAARHDLAALPVAAGRAWTALAWS